MPLKLYQWQVIAGALVAMWLAILRYDNQHDASIALYPVLEAACFLFCMTGVVAGGRSIRSRFEALGSNKSRALADAGYMKDRYIMQLTAALGSASVWSLLAGHFGIAIWTALLVLVGFLLLLPLLNRISGWTTS